MFALEAVELDYDALPSQSTQASMTARGGDTAAAVRHQFGFQVCPSLALVWLFTLVPV